MNTSKNKDFTVKVYYLIKKIPFGKVTTYKEIACALGKPKASRTVGNALNKNKDFKEIKCFKVIKSSGEIGNYALGVKEKIKRLEKEGIEIRNMKIDLKKYFYELK